MPSVESVVDRAFVDLLGKARRRADDEFRRQVPRQSTVNLMFTSGASVLGAGIIGSVQIPFACIPTWCHIYALDANLAFVAVTATVNIQVTNLLNPTTTTPINGTGLPPALVAQSTADIPLTGWLPSLMAQDLILFSLTEITGDASCLCVSIGIRALDGDQVASVVDAVGDTVVDEFGNQVILRG